LIFDPRKGAEHLKIIDLSAGNRAVWFDRNHPDALYIDIRPEVGPSIVADARALPAEVGTGYDLVVFDPPHKNSAASGNMSKRNYGHWTAEQITSILVGTAKEAHRITRPDGLMAFKWNDHTRKLTTVLGLLSPWWEPLFGHGARGQQRHKTMTAWVMLKRRDLDAPFELVAGDLQKSA
jgi:hypothetical protein